ncbi:hypothetical protein C0J52_25091 [Blattella germanica]|nr:hypothetical protein C0J52_25091 [Blattella germanica]
MSTRFAKDAIGFRYTLVTSSLLEMLPRIFCMMSVHFLHQKLLQLENSGCTALQRAAAEGHLDVVKQLIKHGADVNRQDNVVSCVLIYNSKGHRCEQLVFN